MAVLDGADIDEHQVGTGIGWRSRDELWLIAITLQTSLILEKNLLLQRFLEIELLCVPRLANLRMHCKGEMTTCRSQIPVVCFDVLSSIAVYLCKCLYKCTAACALNMPYSKTVDLPCYA